MRPGCRRRRRRWLPRDHRHRAHPRCNGIRLHPGRRALGTGPACAAARVRREAERGHRGRVPRHGPVPLERRHVRRPRVGAARPAGDAGTRSSRPALRALAAGPDALAARGPAWRRSRSTTPSPSPRPQRAGSPWCPGRSAGTTSATSTPSRRCCPTRRSGAEGARRRAPRARPSTPPVWSCPRRGASWPWSASTTSWSSTPRTRSSSPHGSAPRTSRRSSTPSRPPGARA